MWKKYCPRCQRFSFSACRDTWICPYCQEDISSQPEYNINESVHQGGETGTGEIMEGKGNGRRTA
ncbi:MAG: hypothetical protein K6T66_10510 [Peptococcaceae bacterium]|nr:hypothetical protein [Peptococcaceae bacterium]